MNCDVASVDASSSLMQGGEDLLQVFDVAAGRWWYRAPLSRASNVEALTTMEGACREVLWFLQMVAV